MVNDTTTLNGSLQECIDRLETNLQAMGVSDAEFDSSTGILGLIDEIPNISPSVGGIELDTNITLDESNLETEIIGGVKHYKVYNNDRTTLTAYINALYDDTTVDMKGVLQGATVNYDLTQIGGDDSTAISDNDGKFSMVIHPTSLQDDIHYNVYMSFDGTGTDYKSCDELFRFMVRHDYLITFGQSEYTTYDGNCTVTATLTEDGVAMPYVELHLVSGGMTYATLTDGNGVATFNLQNLQTGTETWTCTYKNATATCTVTYTPYLFYDDCSSATGLSQYGEGISLRNSAKTSLAYDSSMNAYAVSNSAQGCGMIPITVLNGENNFKIEFDWYSPNGDVGGGFAMKNTSTNKFHYLSLATYNNRCNWWNATSENFVDNCLTKNNWHHITLTVTSSTVTYDFDNGVATGSYAVNITMDSNVLIGIESQWTRGISGYIKNIIAEPI